MKLTDALLNEFLHQRDFCRHGKVDVPGSAHEVGFLAWPLIKNLTMLRMACRKVFCHDG